MCRVEQGQDLSCSTKAPNNLALRSGQSMYGFCNVTGIPTPYVRWMFCPNVCDNMYLSNVTSSDKCQPVNDYNQNATTFSAFSKYDVRQSDSGLYVCTASYFDAVAAVYNVCVSVGKVQFLVVMNKALGFISVIWKGIIQCVNRSFVDFVFTLNSSVYWFHSLLISLCTYRSFIVNSVVVNLCTVLENLEHTISVHIMYVNNFFSNLAENTIYLT